MQDYTPLAKLTLGLIWAFAALALLSCIAQSSLRWASARRFSIADLLVLLSFLIGLVLVSQSTWAIVDEGQAEHQQELSDSELARAAKSILVGEALWSVVNGLLRIAACLLIHDVFKVKRGLGILTLLIGTLSALVALAAVLQVFLICRPFAAQWEQSILGTCGDQITSFVVLEVFGLVLDVVLLIVPVPLLLSLHLRTARKAAIIVFFDAAAIVLIISALRVAALRDAVSPDFSYSQSYLSLLSVLGTMTTIVCCNLPGLARWFGFMREAPPIKKEGRVRPLYGPSAMEEARTRETGDSVPEPEPNDSFGLLSEKSIKVEGVGMVPQHPPMYTRSRYFAHEFYRPMWPDSPPGYGEAVGLFGEGRARRSLSFTLHGGHQARYAFGPRRYTV